MIINGQFCLPRQDMIITEVKIWFILIYTLQSDAWYILEWLMWVYMMNAIASMKCITSSFNNKSGTCISIINPPSSHLNTTPYSSMIQKWLLNMLFLNLNAWRKYWAPHTLICTIIPPRWQISGLAMIWLSLSCIR